MATLSEIKMPCKGIKAVPLYNFKWRFTVKVTWVFLGIGVARNIKHMLWFLRFLPNWWYLDSQSIVNFAQCMNAYIFDFTLYFYYIFFCKGLSWNNIPHAVWLIDYCESFVRTGLIHFDMLLGNLTFDHI